jgi:hypothetical protein
MIMAGPVQERLTACLDQHPCHLQMPIQRSEMQTRDATFAGLVQERLAAGACLDQRSRPPDAHY